MKRFTITAWNYWNPNQRIQFSLIAKHPGSAESIAKELFQIQWGTAICMQIKQVFGGAQ